VLVISSVLGLLGSYSKLWSAVPERHSSSLGSSTAADNDVPAAGMAKIGATLGVFVLPILKGRFGVPAVLGMMAAVSVLGLLVTLVFGCQDTEH